MAVRTSRGIFLEVLEPAAQTNLPIELDVYDGANPGTMIATLENAWDAAFQAEMAEVGAGAFYLSRSDPKATPAILAKGNLVKVKTGGINRGAFWIEEPVEVLTSTAEASGENWEVKGRGVLAMLERALVYPPVWPVQPASFRSASQGSNADAGATTVSIVKPSGTTNGDVLIAGIAFVGGSDKTISPPVGWKEFRRINNGTDLGIALFRKQAGSSEPSSYQWAFSNTTQAVGNILALYNASADFTTYSFTSEYQGTGTAIKSPSLSIGEVDGAVLAFAAATAGSGMTPPTGYTEAADHNTRPGRVLESSYLLGPALGDTGDVITTNTSSAEWIGLHLYVPSSGSNDATFGGETFGGVLGTLIDRAQARGAILDLTYDFTGTADSQGNPWADTFDLSFHAGTSLLDVWRHLASLGMEGGMSHDLKLSAFQDMSRDRTGDVILRKGSHFLGEVANTGHYVDLRTRYLVEGAGGRIVEVTDPALEAIPTIGRREGFLSMATSDAATDLSRAGTVALSIASLQDAARTIPVDHGLVADGQYEPWEDYRIGDYIGLDPDGTGEITAERVVGVTISHRDSLDYNVVLDLNSVTLEANVRMRRQMDALAKTSSGGAGGSSALSLGGGGATGGGGAGGTVAAAGGDTPGYLFDKVDVAGALTKTLGGVTGNRTVALGVGTGTPDGSKFLRDDGVWANPPAGGGAKIYTRRDGAGTVVNPEPAPYTVVPNIAAVSVVLDATSTIIVSYSARIAKGSDSDKVRFLPHRGGVAMGSDRYSQSVGESSQQDVSGIWLARDLAPGSYDIDMRHQAAIGTSATTFYEQILVIQVTPEA